MTRVKTVKATLAYHGAKFSGWQIQRQGERTVQAVLEDAIQKVTDEQPKLIVASRTDAGVHARDQVVQFQLAHPKPQLTPSRLQDALNFHLPIDVAVQKIQFVSNRFNARYGPKKKHYRYQIHASRSKPVFDADTCCWVRSELDAAKMRQAARSFVGRHDFTAFSALSDDCEDKTRVIFKFTVKHSVDRITCDIVGDSFLQHMIRIMMGTLIEIGKGNRPASDVRRLIRGRDRLQAGPTAAPHGLTLLKVYY